MKSTWEDVSKVIYWALFLMVILGCWLLPLKSWGVDPDDALVVERSRAPTVNDASPTYKPGTIWIYPDGSEAWIMITASPGAARWVQLALGAQTANSIPYFEDANNLGNVSTGSSGQQLTSLGADQAPTWDYIQRPNLLTNTGFRAFSRATGTYYIEAFRGAIEAGDSGGSTGVSLLSTPTNTLVTGYFIGEMGDYDSGPSRYQASAPSGISVFEITGVSTATTFTVESGVSGGDKAGSGDTVFGLVAAGIMESDGSSYGPEGWWKESGVSIWVVSLNDYVYSNYREHAALVVENGSATPFASASETSPYYVAFRGETDPAAGTEQPLPWKRKFYGQTLVMGAWIKADSADKAQLAYYDDGWNTVGPRNSSSSWEWMEGNFTLGTSGDTIFPFGVKVYSGGTVYITQPMLAYGNYLGEGNYLPGNPVVNLEQLVTPAGYNEDSIAAGTATVNVPARTRLKILDPTAVQLIIDALGSTSGYQVAVLGESGITSVVIWSTPKQDATINLSGNGRVYTGLDGDFQFYTEEALTSGLVTINTAEF